MFRSAPLLLTLLALPAATQSPGIVTLHAFNVSDGAVPVSTPTVDAAGTVYGTTGEGGPEGLGVVYAISPAGKYKVLRPFHGPDGALPIAGLTPGPDGTLYGTTYGGGPDDGGTVFSITPHGHFTRLHVFPATGDFNANVGGAAPNAGVALVPTKAGTARGPLLLGATEAGGASGLGTLFVLAGPGRFAVLHEFAGQPAGDGAYPEGTPVQGPDGAWYGTTYAGGRADNGTVYRLDAGTGRVTVLHSFTGVDGAGPEDKLTPAPDGFLYGTTRFGGDSSDGVVFRLLPTGAKFHIMHRFGGGADGARPFAELTEHGGVLYGTTFSGGADNRGTVFSLTPDGTETILRQFAPESDGSFPHGQHPWGGVAFGPHNTLYGTTFGGGPSNQGTVFRLTLP